MKPTKIFSIPLFIAIAVFATGFVYQDKKPWPVPDKFNKMTNPVATNADAIKDGKAIWAKHCQSCHGKNGLGDGPKAAQLKTEPGDFSLPVIQKQSDGAFFYKISEGRDDMPSFKKKIPEQEEIWQVVTYLRTFKK